MIISTFDTEVIISSIVLDKRRRDFKIRDFEKMLPMQHQLSNFKDQAKTNEVNQAKKKLTIVQEELNVEDSTHMRHNGSIVTQDQHLITDHDRMLFGTQSKQVRHGSALEEELRSLS